MKRCWGFTRYGPCKKSRGQRIAFCDKHHWFGLYYLLACTSVIASVLTIHQILISPATPPSLQLFIMGEIQRRELQNQANKREGQDGLADLTWWQRHLTSTRDELIELVKQARSVGYERCSHRSTSRGG